MLASLFEADRKDFPIIAETPAAIDGFRLIGVSHLTADLAIRSAFSLSAATINSLTAALKTRPEQEFLALSTCNRTEIYFVGIEKELVLDALAENSKLCWADLSSVVYEKSGLAGVEHLFEVACGLNSAVVGESEILGQLKASFTVAEGLGSVGRVLRPLMQRAFRVSKRVRSETELGRRGLSLASVAVRRASALTQGLADKHVLVVGAGQIAESIAKNLQHQGCRAVTICSRTMSRAFALAAMYGYNAVPLSQLKASLAESDVVFCAVSVDAPILSEELCKDSLRPGAILIDLGVPANVAPEIRSASRAHVIDMQDLTNEVFRNVAHVSEAAPKAMEMVRAEVEIYRSECVERESAPSIESLVKRMENVRQRNLEWALSQVPVENLRERKLIEDLSIRLTRGMLSEPIQKLKNDFREPAERAVLARFFQAEE